MPRDVCIHIYNLFFFLTLKSSLFVCYLWVVVSSSLKVGTYSYLNILLLRNASADCVSLCKELRPWMLYKQKLKEGLQFLFGGQNLEYKYSPVVQACNLPSDLHLQNQFLC